MSADSPLVSVLVPIYGVEKYIERCARSIFEQTYNNLEIIFVNDCTPDLSIDVLRRVLKEYPSRISQTRIIDHNVNKGLAAARKTALMASTGYYIQNYDSDDYVEKDMIRRMVYLAQRSDADITICDYKEIYGVKHNHYINVNPPLNGIKCLELILSGKMHSSICNKLIKRTLYFNNSVFPIDGLNMLEDVSVMFRLMYYAKEMAYIPEAFYNYDRCNINSYTFSLSEKSRSNILDVIFQIDSFFKEHAVNSEVLRAFDIFKLLSKVMLIVAASTQKERKRYIKLFTDINYKTYRQNITFSNYVVLLFSDKGLFMANVISLLKQILRRCKFMWNISISKR